VICTAYIAKNYHLDGRRIVFANGCFDLFHASHLAFLQHAATYGFLIVGVNTDSSVKSLKGSKRPIIPFLERAAIVDSLKCVGCVVPLEETTPDHIIDIIDPNIIVDGAEHSITMERYGKTRIVHLLSPSLGVTTTGIIKKIAFM
jgi:D-beta-D-heptose 7-phosphate kinase/D-beta-D-heptose 1-phosphate adenosyltransferase